MTNQPKFTRFTGKGVFTSGDCCVDMHFTVQRQFSHVVFLAQDDNHRNVLFVQFSKKQPWSLSGQLEDGRCIHADQLVHTGWGSEGHAEFSPLAGVIIGQSNQSPPVEARYPLVGMFNGKFSVEDSGWSIEVFDSEENASCTKDLSKALAFLWRGLRSG